MDFHRNSLTENNELLTACTRNRSFSAKSKLCAFSKVPFQTEIEVFLIRHFLYPLTVIAACGRTTSTERFRPLEVLQRDSIVEPGRGRINHYTDKINLT